MCKIHVEVHVATFNQFQQVGCSWQFLLQLLSLDVLCWKKYLVQPMERTKMSTRACDIHSVIALRSPNSLALQEIITSKCSIFFHVPTCIVATIEVG